MKKTIDDVWARVLSKTPLFVRGRASGYLQNVKRFQKNEWLFGVVKEHGTKYAWEKTRKLHEHAHIHSKKEVAIANTSALLPHMK